MAETISVSCNNSCTGTCLNICMQDCNGLCTDSASKGVFGYDDDAIYNDPTGILGEKTGNCTTCTGTCLSLCGNDCEGGCSRGCIDGCTGDCSEACTLGCQGSCNDACTDSCGDECNSSCKHDCVSSCMGICEGCTGCSNTCKNECENQCIFSCVGNANSSENGGMLDFSQADMETILRTLRWRKISEFPLSPTILNDDKLIVIDDASQAEALDKLSVLMSENGDTKSVNTLENMDMLVSDYSLKTVRVTAAEFVEYLSTHIKNFVLWYPVYDKESHKLKWVRTVNEKEPVPIDILETMADISVATHENKGLMSAEDKTNLDILVATDFATQEELDTYKEEVAETFETTKNDINTTLDTTYVKKSLLVEKLDELYNKTEVDTLLNGKSDTDHLHDDRYLKLTDYINDTETVNADIDKAFNAVSLTDTNITGEQEISGEEFPQSSSVDHVEVTKTYTFTSRGNTETSIDIPYEYYKYRMATATYGGLLSNTDYVTIHKIPDYLTEVRQDVPSIVKEKVKVSELANDVGYLTAKTLPIATDTILGGVKIATDSRISVDTAGFINTKDFGASNMIKNSTFAYGSKYWEVSDDNTTIRSDDVFGTNQKCGVITMPLNSYILQETSSTYGKYLTLSFDAMGSGNFVIDITMPNASANIIADLNSASWAHYSYTVDLGDSSLVNAQTIMIKISNSGEGASGEVELWLKNIMLQNGMYDTGWTPNVYDGNAVLGFENPYSVDGTTIIETNGVLSSPSEIDDSPLTNSSLFSTEKTFSNQGIKAYIPIYIGNNQLSMTNKLRFTEIYNNSAGYGVIFDRTSTMFSIRATDVNNALSDDIRQKEVTDSEGNTTYVDDIPFRIDLQNNTCSINGSSFTSTYSQMTERALADIYGRQIDTTYVTISEFNAVLEQLKTAIDALNDINTETTT